MSFPIDQGLVDQWATAPAPAGIDPKVWADAQKTRVERARPWDEEALQRLPQYMSGLLREDHQNPQERGQKAA